jgi:hypothetical protein
MTDDPDDKLHFYPWSDLLNRPRREMLVAHLDQSWCSYPTPLPSPLSGGQVIKVVNLVAGTELRRRTQR